MALILVGRRIPVVRYLSALANGRADVVLGIHSTANCASTGAAGSENASSAKTKVEPVEAGSGSPAESGTVTSAASSPYAGAPPASTSQPSTVEDDGEWTEVVHTSGQVYYWNQRTGETTNLGEPKPKSERRGSGGGSSGGSADQGGSAGSGGGRAAEGHMHDPRAEAHLEDRTGTYAGMGVIIGAFLGWVSQFV